jgi:hypothetical protein
LDADAHHNDVMRSDIGVKLLITSSCNPQIVSINENARLQSVINKKWLNPNLTCGTSIGSRSTEVAMQISGSKPIIVSVRKETK